MCVMHKWRQYFKQKNTNLLAILFILTNLQKPRTNRKLSNQDIYKITNLRHQNLIALKKIAKSKKNGQQQLFWLYYQTFSHNLQACLTKTNFDITCELVESSLNSLRTYLISSNIIPEFHDFNIGISNQGIVKIYISIENILKKDPVCKKALQDCEDRVKQIKNWYGKIYSRKSYRRNQLPKAISQKQLLNSNITKIEQIKQDLEKLRKNIKSQEQKNCHTQFLSPCYKAIKKYHQLLTKQKKSEQYQKQNTNNLKVNNKVQSAAKIHIPHIKCPIPPMKYTYEFDNQSVDTYQMQMGQDLQMPSIRTNQRLRQTVINNKTNWDTLTHKPPLVAANKSKVHLSAGKKDFMKIIQSSKKKLKQSAKKMQSYSDSKTVHEKFSPKNWQTSTIKSTLPPNIQNRVQQALTKTKNVMQMLKNTKIFSAGK